MIARVEYACPLVKDLHVEHTLQPNKSQEKDVQGKEKHEEDQGRHLIQDPKNRRPDALRRITYPDSYQTNTAVTPPISSRLPPVSPHNNNNNKSPYRPQYTPRAHLRSRSSGSAVAPPMSRTHSSSAVPAVRSGGPFSSSPVGSPSLTPSSPLPSPGSRSLSPFQPLYEDTHPASMTSSPLYDGAIGSISEDSELNFVPRISFDHMPQPIPLHATLNSARPLSVRRQRPTSPLHSLGNPTHTSHSRSSSAASSPSIPSVRYNEGFPTLTHYSSTSSFSSLASTPTSARSRSPSVSSLDTIEDEPDLEWEAIETDRAAKLQAAAEAAKNGEEVEGRRRGSLDIPGARSGVGFGFGRRGDNSKKRWSVCGGERRADLDLETIWED